MGLFSKIFGKDDKSANAAVRLEEKAKKAKEHVYLSSLELFNMPSIDSDEAAKFTKHLFPYDHFDFDGAILPKSMLFYTLKYAYPRHSFGHAYLLSTDIDSFVAQCSSKGLSNSSDVFKKYVVGHVEIEYGGDLDSTPIQVRTMKL